jgi:SAM-dependent methyltransferase
MTQPVPPPPQIVDQAEYWNGPAGQKWAEMVTTLDTAMMWFSGALLDLIAAQPGERALDVGCGAGTTTLALAKAVGPTGEVLGVDISDPMLAVATERLKPMPWAKTLVADAATQALPANHFQVLASRFGVMFFDDPVAAFRNLYAAAAPGGRFVFCCWRQPKEQGWVTVPFRAIADLFEEQPPQDPNAPGPFAFANAERLEGILREAGFTSISIAARDLPWRPTETGGAKAAAAFISQIGPVARMLADAPEPVRAEAIARMEPALAKFETNGLVELPAAIWLVSARKPG